MDIVIPVFQFEIRYNHILNFSQIARGLLAPYVKLTDSIKIDKQNTLEETYALNFEEEVHMIIVSWDRIVFKGQGNLDTYTQKNSPLEVLFFDIFKRIRGLDEFGEIQRSLFFGVSLMKINDFNIDSYLKKMLVFDPMNIVKDLNDIAIVLESKNDYGNKSSVFGPYLSRDDIMKRTIRPVNIESLGDLDFLGIIMEYKRIKLMPEVTFDDFVEHCSEFKDTYKNIWKTQ